MGEVELGVGGDMERETDEAKFTLRAILLKFILYIENMHTS